jgi:mannose-6-phosphate isomerase-like protein (cupin superfamily)
VTTDIDHPSAWRVLHNRHTGEVLELRRVMRDGQPCLELNGTLPPHREGPPLHIHFNEYEEGIVISGTLAAEVDGRQMQVGPGGIAALPAGSTHRWWNGGDEPLSFRGTVTPLVDLDVYLEAVFDVANSGSSGRPPLFYLAHVLWRHRRTQALAPRWLQAVLVPVIVLVGTILGRYRGSDWPGCPDRISARPGSQDSELAGVPIRSLSR